MNKTAIETCDLTTNPVSGCDRDCWYCYAKRGYERFHRSFKPTFHPDRLPEIGHMKGPTEANNKTRKSWIVKAFPHTWLTFVCSVSDLFAPWTLEPWRDAVLEKIREPSEDDVIFQLLTKCPSGIPDDSTFKRNVWLGVTATCQEEAPLLEDLVGVGVDIPSEGKFFASFEPLLGSIVLPIHVLDSLDWVIIGKLTGSRRVKLQGEWVDTLISQARTRKVPVFIKNSVVKELGPKYQIREFPK